MNTLELLDVGLTTEDEARVHALIKNRHTASPEDREALSLAAKLLNASTALKKKCSKGNTQEVTQ